MGWDRIRWLAGRWLRILTIIVLTVAVWGIIDLKMASSTGLEYAETYFEKLRADVYLARYQAKLAKQASGQVVLVPITEDTFADLGVGPPVPRNYHATVIRRLKEAGAKVIAFDLLFDLPRETDTALAAAAREAGNVMWAGADLENNGETGSCDSNARLARPNPTLRKASPYWGQIHLPRDSNRPAVDLIEAVMCDGDDLVPAFSVEAAALASTRRDMKPRRVRDTWRIGKMLIPVDELGLFKVSYFGKPGKTFPTLPYELVYRDGGGQFVRDNHFFRDKIVIVGDTTKAGHDSFLTPVGDMAGMEIHAHAIASLLERGLVFDASPGQNLFVMAILVTLTCVLAAFGRPRFAALLVGLLIVGYYCFNMWAYVERSLSLHFVAPVAAIITAAIGVIAQRAVDEELQKSQARVQLEAARKSEQQAEIARQAADEANKAKSAFLANMSHELRTPLNAIIGYSEMLEEEVEDLGVSELAPDLRKIRTAGKHLLALINDVLDFSKIEAGKMDLYLETFDIATMVQEVESIIVPLVEKNGNKLVVDIPEDIGKMHADLTKVKQGLFNLLSNASKFTKEGTITIQVVREVGSIPATNGSGPNGEWIVMNVTDTGIGMTPEQLGRMFQAFSQAEAGTTRKYGGTGLGLAITKHFSQMMGGDVTVTSEYGVGTTFTIRLPAQVVESKPVEPAATH